MTGSPPPGWYPLPADPRTLGWWNGHAWADPATLPPGPAAPIPFSAPATRRGLVGHRLAAWLLDVALTLLVFAPTYLDPGMRGESRYVEPHPAALLPMLAAVVFLFWNWGYRQGTTGQSLGKQVLGIMVVRCADQRPTGAPIGSVRALFTALTSFGLLALVTLIVAVVSPREQRIADLVLNTEVVPSSRKGFASGSVPMPSAFPGEPARGESAE